MKKEKQPQRPTLVTDQTTTYSIVEHIYMKDGIQRTKHSLLFGDMLVATEDYSNRSNAGELKKIIDSMLNIYESEFQCNNCRYKVGDYTGDIGYLLYVAFRSRTRLKFFKFKVRLFQILKIPIVKKCKPTTIE